MGDVQQNEPEVVDDELSSSGPGAGALGSFAVGLGVVALVSSWTGWGGLIVGLVTIACAVWALMRRRTDPTAGWRRAVVGLVIGLVAVVIGGVVEYAEYFGDGGGDSSFGHGLTLDQCMAQAPIAKLQHLCKSQHLDEFQQRYPNADE